MTLYAAYIEEKLSKYIIMYHEFIQINLEVLLVKFSPIVLKY